MEAKPQSGMHGTCTVHQHTAATESPHLTLKIFISVVLPSINRTFKNSESEHECLEVLHTLNSFYRESLHQKNQHLFAEINAICKVNHLCRKYGNPQKLFDFASWHQFWSAECILLHQYTTAREMVVSIRSGRPESLPTSSTLLRG